MIPQFSQLYSQRPVRSWAGTEKWPRTCPFCGFLSWTCCIPQPPKSPPTTPTPDQEELGLPAAPPLDLGLKLSNVVFRVAKREMTVRWARKGTNKGESKEEGAGGVCHVEYKPGQAWAPLRNRSLPDSHLLAPCWLQGKVTALCRHQRPPIPASA